MSQLTDNGEKKTIHVYGHGFLDYKYKRVFEPIGVQFHAVVFFEWLRMVWGMNNHNRDKVFHIRYLLWKGFFMTLPMYLMILISCKIKKIPVIWTCHNIWEHGMPSRFYNKLLKFFVSRGASGIIVLHKDLKRYLGRSKKKVRVACFGEFKTLMDEHPDRCSDFEKEYENWVSQSEIVGPDFVFIGEYSKEKRIEGLIEVCRKNPEIYALIVGPKMPQFDALPNVFVYNQKVVHEVGNILGSHNVVGYVAHNNLSLPTAINLYASYGIPCVVSNFSPLNTIIDEWKVGEKFSSVEEIESLLIKIQRNYHVYSEAAVKFADFHTWERSQKIHDALLKELTNQAVA